jgi:small ligand-binding sensory domain FIST
MSEPQAAMRWASEVSVEPALDAALGAAARAVGARLGAAPDLVVLFVAEQHRAHFDRVPERVSATFPSALLIGCSAGGVIGGGREVEHAAAVSLTAAVLPDVTLAPFHVESNMRPGVPEQAAWEAVIGVASEREPQFILLPDPFTFDAERLLRDLDGAYPRSRKIGGLASGGHQPGSNALFLGGEVFRAGLVGVALSGNIEVDTIVAQGCRPIGQPMFITRCQDHVLFELDGQPAVHVLETLFETLSPADKRLAQHSLFLGLVMSADRQEYHQGDFLIRNIIGMDSARGALAVGAVLRDNIVVQFHLRDARTSADDLEAMLSRFRVGHPQGALLFSCLGRGAQLYGSADHDTNAFRRALGDVSLGGFFCNGEIGPVHGTTFLHGYTSSFGLFRSKHRT